MADLCRQLSDISAGIPWVLLSGGGNFTTFQRQVEIACDAGASGFVAGRAIWQEALADAAARDRFLNTIAVSRSRVLVDTATYWATPSFERVTDRIPQNTWPASLKRHRREKGRRVFHVANVPGRHEPDTGELNYHFIAQVLRDAGYEGIVGLEAFAKSNSNEAMERSRAAFSNALSRKVLSFTPSLARLPSLIGKEVGVEV